MAKKTIVIDGDDRQHFSLVVEEGVVRIGDTPSHTEGVARDLRITRIHCEVEVEDDRDHMAIDEPGVLAPRTLFPGTAVQLGHVHLVLVPATPSPATVPGETVAASAAPGAPIAPGHAQWLRVVDGANQGRVFRLPDAGVVTVGKTGKQVEVGLDDMYVMRMHCSLEIAGDGVAVTHLDGPNGTLIDGKRISLPQSLRPGNVLRVGNSHLRLESGVFPAEAPAAEPKPPSSNEGSGVLRAANLNKPPQKAKPEDPLAALSGHEFGQFQVGKLLGRGQTGAVYSATNSKTSQVVALKVLSADFPAAPAELERFARELKAVQHIRHPNLVAQYSGGKTGVHCWIARELVEGESAESVRSRIAEGEKPSWSRAARVAIHLARALDCLHQHRLVHGNITPRNIVIAATDHVAKLADLALVQALEGSRLAELVREKKRLAELPYAAPEQVEPNGFVDGLADLYGVGATAYALVTGRPPVSGKTAAEITAQISTGWIAKPSSIYKKTPAEFDAVIMKLLARHQEDRYATARAALNDLESLAQQHEIKL